MRSAPRAVFSFAVLIVPVLLIVSGCGAPDPRDMDEIERARTIADLRKKADDAWGRFVADPEDYESLDEFANLHEETTTIAPRSCPRCFFNFGLAVRRVGNYWRGLAQDAARDLDDAETPDPAREAEFDQYLQNAKEAYVKSNRAFTVFLRQSGPDRARRARAYFQMIDNYVGLEDYSSALHYLEIFEQSLEPENTASRKAIVDIRQELQQRLLLQEEKMLQGELDNEAEFRDARRREQSAN